MSAERATAIPLTFGTGMRSPNGKARLPPIPAADGAAIDRKNDMILARYQGKVYAFGLACPHRNTALWWLAEGSRFQCPKRKSKQAPMGRCSTSVGDGRWRNNLDRWRGWPLWLAYRPVLLSTPRVGAPARRG